MDAFIYFDDALLFGLDSLEDVLDNALSEIGEVTGTGTGKSGGNIDIVINDETISKSDVLQIIRRAVSTFEFPMSSRIVIDGEVFSLRDSI